MSIRRITSLLVGVAFVGGSLSAYIYAPWKGRAEAVECMLLIMFVVGMVMAWKGAWGENEE